MRLTFSLLFEEGANWAAEGRDLAKHFNTKFIETSAKQRINVDEAFSNLVREIRRYNKVRRRSPRPGYYSLLGSLYLGPNSTPWRIVQRRPSTHGRRGNVRQRRMLRRLRSRLTRPPILLLSCLSLSLFLQHLFLVLVPVCYLTVAVPLR